MSAQRCGQCGPCQEALLDEPTSPPCTQRGGESPHTGILGSQAARDMLSVKRTCNLHDDCEAANVRARASGRLAADHCHDDCCEDCFGS